YVENLLNVFNKVLDCTYDEVASPVAGKLYYTFASDANGDYVYQNGTYRELLNTKDDEGNITGKEDAGDKARFARSYAMVVGGKKRAVSFVKDPDGEYTFDENKGTFVPVYAGVGANNIYSVQVGDELANDVKLYARNDIEEYVDQNISFSVSGLVYFNSNGVGYSNLGGLVESLLGDMLIELQTLSAFHNGIGFKLSANLDLGAINFAGLMDSSGDHGSILDSDFDKIELALELIETNTENDFVKIPKKQGSSTVYVDKVLGGIYLHNGSLYLDATGIVDVAENYSKIDNFMDILNAIIDKGGAFIDKIKTVFSSEENSDAVTSADGGNNQVIRDAILALVYGDKAFQIQLTRSILSLLISSILPDLGSIEDVFDMFEISLNVQHGEEIYSKVADIEAGVPAEEKTKYYEIEIGGNLYYVTNSYQLYYKDGEGQYHEAAPGYVGTTYVLYYDDYREVLHVYDSVEVFDTELFKKDRYTYFEDENYETIDNVNGKYAAVEINGWTYLPISIYNLYHKDGEGKLVKNEGNKFLTAGANYIIYNGAEKAVDSLRTRRFGYVKSDLDHEYTLDKNGMYKKVADEY
ncbi:MAG: hypothetical protein II867_04825, partial [Clostridia bacterium]|nr:hypothetical protein [Clostridia bacterium]